MQSTDAYLLLLEKIHKKLLCSCFLAGIELK